jgi:hypothetical protein
VVDCRQAGVGQADGDSCRNKRLELSIIARLHEVDKSSNRSRHSRPAGIIDMEVGNGSDPVVDSSRNSFCLRDDVQI